MQLSNSPPFRFGTNVVGTKVYRAAFSGILSSGALLLLIGCRRLPLIRVIAHYHKVELISTLLAAAAALAAPRRPSPPALIENE
ncbi:hypothetical protein QQF64_017267 [Cirrhinus molitorella]|uniref:Uncharacterized protein n=1 Tax=Cirrhinus molitorella TaxID=172907 RepID=A0ABR3LI59_9TELE